MSRKRPGQLLLPTALALSLTACATNSTLSGPQQPAKIPPPPVELMVPPDLKESYSDSVRRLLLEWRQKLTDWRRSS